MKKNVGLLAVAAACGLSAFVSKANSGSIITDSVKVSPYSTTVQELSTTIVTNCYVVKCKTFVGITEESASVKKVTDKDLLAMEYAK